MSQVQNRVQTQVRDGAVAEAPERTVEFTLRLGYSYSRSGRCWFRRFIVKAWVKEGGAYVEASPTAVIEAVEKDWHISRTKKYADATLVAKEGTIIKVFETKSPRYYLVTAEAEGGLKPLEHESVPVDVVATPKFRVRYFKNIVYLPGGGVLEDVDADPKLYIYGRRVDGEWRLSRLSELKKVLGVG